MTTAKKVYNLLVTETESLTDFGYGSLLNSEISANIIYLLGAILNDSYIEIEHDSATIHFFSNLSVEFNVLINPFVVVK